MIMVQWNSLRVGDRVLVHDDRDPKMSLAPGVVAIVQGAPGSNDLAIRISADDAHSAIVRPRRLAVHLDQLDPDELCWRCAIAHATDHVTSQHPALPPSTTV